MIGHFNTKHGNIKQTLLELENDLNALSFFFFFLFNSAIRVTLIKQHVGIQIAFGHRPNFSNPHADQGAARTPAVRSVPEVHSLGIRSEVIANLFLGNRKTH